MTEKSSKFARRPVIRLVAILLLTCIISAAYLGVNALRQQVRSMIGQPEVSLSANQTRFYELNFFLNQGKIVQKGRTTQTHLFVIESGQSIDQIITGLAFQGIVSDKNLFRDLLIYTGVDRHIMPGKYQIPAGSSMRDVLFLLQDSSSILVDFNILPGWRMEEIAESLPTSGLSISPTDFLAAAGQPVADKTITGGDTFTHEGFMPPGMYSFRRDVNLDEVLNGFLERFRREVTPDMREAYSVHGLSTVQAVTLASIVQREAVLDEEKPRIASVFLNRLRQGMPLQTDPTVQYSLGFSPEWGWWKSPLSFQDLAVNSPYNTYIINGLPPTPISNPDEASLMAVAFPEESPYLYFRATCDGSGKHVFSETIEEHSMNGCQ